MKLEFSWHFFRKILKHQTSLKSVQLQPSCSVRTDRQLFHENRKTGRWTDRLCNTYLLNPYSTVLLEKLTGSAASQEIPHIFGTRRFLTVPTSARHLSLSWANSIQSPQLPPTSWRSILILTSHLCLGLPNGLFPSGFPTRTYFWKICRENPSFIWIWQE